MKVAAILAAAMLVAAPPLARAAAPIAVVAAENFYGDVAEQIGGPDVAVTSILSNPDQDPHLFEASPSVAAALAGARIVVYSGIDYDPWIVKLLHAVGGHDRTVIDVAALTHRKSGDNPHIWYDPATMPALARTLAADLGAIDPPHRAAYQRRLLRFENSLQPVDAKVASLRRRLAGTPATATEPVFGYMLAALGMPSRNQRFQLAVMNDTEPSAGDVAAFEDDLRHHRVQLLVYNSQATDEVARRMVAIATAAHVPVIGATETEPPGLDYQAWMMRELDAVARALPPREER
ncbi:MAG TPA: zinc ABC transporter substrate-binding protein [Stellaceae bacterium]|nr:zinc ABC transporter substrate-binding protein [Stellaceae bacterium]